MPLEEDAQREIEELVGETFEDMGIDPEDWGLDEGDYHAE